MQCLVKFHLQQNATKLASSIVLSPRGPHLLCVRGMFSIILTRYVFILELLDVQKIRKVVSLQVPHVQFFLLSSNISIKLLLKLIKTYIFSFLILI